MNGSIHTRLLVFSGLCSNIFYIFCIIFNILECACCIFIKQNTLSFYEHPDKRKEKIKKTQKTKLEMF